MSDAARLIVMSGLIDSMPYTCSRDYMFARHATITVLYHRNALLMREINYHPTRQCLLSWLLHASEETIKAVVDDAPELDALLACNAVPVRLRIRRYVMRLDLNSGIETQKPHKNVVHQIYSLLVLSRVVPVNNNLAEVRCLCENTGDEDSSLA